MRLMPRPGCDRPANDPAVSDDPRALLLGRAASGDRDAFDHLARALARPALALCIRVLGDPAAAEDAVQDALAKLWREAHRFDAARGSFGAWWRRMLMNVALDGRRRLRPVEPLDAAVNIAAPGRDPEAATGAALLAARVQAAAAALPARQRAALAMFHGDGLAMAEIAQALDTTEKAVEGLLLRARATLKQELSDLKDELP